MIKIKLPVIEVRKNYWLVSISRGNSIFYYHGPNKKLDHFMIHFDGVCVDHESLYMPYVWIAQQVRKLLPIAYWIGLQDCDSGGMVTASFNIQAYNEFHLNKIRSRVN